MGADAVIVAFGDSITAGQHLADSAKAWPRLLRAQAILVMGVPGDTTRLALERFPRDVQAIDPDIAILQFGHNDCNRWETDHGLPRVSQRAFTANLIEMIDRCRVFEIKPMLCTLTPSYRSEQHARDVAGYDQIVRWVAKDEFVPLIDVREAFEANPDEGFLMEDGLHLTEFGHAAYAEVVQQTLDREGLS